MKLTGKLKTQVDNAPTKEEKREAIKQAGMLLSDDELDKVAGGGENIRICIGCAHLYNYGDEQCQRCSGYHG